MSLLTKASLVMTPNAIKESKVYSIIPSNGNGDLTFTRGTLASSTLTNDAGLIETVPYNLLTFSEQFDNVIWIKSFSTITPNVINSPNGTLTADKLVEDTTTNNHRVFETTNFVAGTVTFSVYAKAGERNWMNLSIFDGGTTKKCYFDLTNGTLGTPTDLISQSITSVGNGWYRCVITGNVVTNGQSQIYLSLSDGGGAYLGNGTSGLYLWGAQTVQDSLPKDYFYTTDRLNVPRLNYDTAGGCPSLLLEPQRTNLVFPSATLTTQTRTVTAVAHTLSFYGTGTVVLAGAFIGTLTGTGANNKVTLTFTPTAGSLILTVTGTATNAQLEAGAYATSYIPTVSGTVTRNADVFSRNSIYTNNLITTAGGTWFVELNNNVSLIRDATSAGLTIDSSAGYFFNGFLIRNNFNGVAARLAIEIRMGGSVVSGGSYNTLTDTLKIAIKWDGVNANVYVNGVIRLTNVPFTTKIMENFGGFAQDVPRYIKSMYLFPTPLTNAECIALTT